MTLQLNNRILLQTVIYLVCRVSLSIVGNKMAGIVLLMQSMFPLHVRDETTMMVYSIFRTLKKYNLKGESLLGIKTPIHIISFGNVPKYLQ